MRNEKELISLQKSYDAAVKILKKHHNILFNILKSLPQEKFLSCSAVLAFHDYLSELATKAVQNPKEAHETLLQLKDTLSSRSTQKFDTLWWPALIDTLENYAISLSSLLNQIDGKLMDLNFTE